MTVLSTWLITVFTRTRNGQYVAGITGLVPFPLLPLDVTDQMQLSRVSGGMRALAIYWFLICFINHHY